MRVILFVLLALVGVMVMAPPSHAQVALENFNKPLTEHPMLPEEQFIAQTQLFDETVADDSSLHYRIRLPQDWTARGAANFGGAASVLSEIGSYRGPVRLVPPSEVRILTQELEFEQPVKFWFLQYVLDQGYALRGVSAFDDGSIEALYVVVERGVDYAVRVRALRNAKSIVMAEYTMPLSEWPEEKIMQMQTLRSFTLAHPSRVAVEETRSHQFLDISQFDYPVSWGLDTPPVRNADRMRAKLVIARPYGTFAGEIEVHGVSQYAAESLSKEVGRFKEDLAARGLTFGKLIEQHKDIATSADARAIVMEAYEAKDESGQLIDYEFWFTILQMEEYYYFVTLLSPSRDENVRDWVRNTGTYRQVVGSVSIAEFSHSAQ